MEQEVLEITGIWGQNCRPALYCGFAVATHGGES